MATAGHSLEERPSTRHVRVKKILVVDRDEYWGPAMRLALEECGYYLNLVREPAEGRRRAFERVYDLVIVSASMGEAAVRAILAELGRRGVPPPVVVVAGAGELRNRAVLETVPCVSLVRRPCPVEDVVDAARALVGDPWEDRLRGA
jgi:DNA-binding response OmpR family regulator